MQAVFCFVKDDGCFAFEDLVGDFHAVDAELFAHFLAQIRQKLGRHARIEQIDNRMSDIKGTADEQHGVIKEAEYKNSIMVETLTANVEQICLHLTALQNL